MDNNPKNGKKGLPFKSPPPFASCIETRPNSTAGEDIDHSYFTRNPLPMETSLQKLIPREKFAGAKVPTSTEKWRKAKVKTERRKHGLLKKDEDAAGGRRDLNCICGTDKGEYVLEIP